MTPEDETQRTVGGIPGKAIGKAKEVLGQAGASDELERERLANQVAAAQREAQIEQDRAATEHRADARAANERVAADAEQTRERDRAERSVRAAEDSRVSAVQEANRLEREAHAAERRADELDPTETGS
jgi:hypothetical protein